MISDSKKCFISVLMPVFNSEKTLSSAIESILNQSFGNFEFIIINDGSTDKSKEIILSFNDPRIRYIENEYNLKLIKTLNIGLRLAVGDYIVRMDSDDISFKNRIEEQVNFMNMHKDVIVSGTWAITFGDYIKTLKPFVSNENIMAEMFLNSPLIHPSTIFRTKIIHENNLSYNEQYLHIEDYKFWYDASKYGELANIPKILLKYRLSAIQVSQKYNYHQKKLSAKLRREFISDFFKSSPINFNYKTKIDLVLIKKIITIKKGESRNNQRIYDAILFSMYMSLNKYSSHSFYNFIFSASFFRYPWNMMDFLRFIYKHFNPNKWESYL